MVRAFMIEGCTIGLFVIANGIYIVAFPPVNDEPQGYAIIAIGIFIILITLNLNRTMGKDSECLPPQ